MRWLVSTVNLMSCRCADYVLLNKRDMLVKGELESLIEIVHTLNPLAQVH